MSHPTNDKVGEARIEAQAEKRAKKLEPPEYIYDEDGNITYLNN